MLPGTSDKSNGFWQSTILNELLRGGCEGSSLLEWLGTFELCVVETRKMRS